MKAGGLNSNMNNNNNAQDGGGGGGASTAQFSVKFDKQSSGGGGISDELNHICKILNIDPSHLQPK